MKKNYLLSLCFFIVLINLPLSLLSQNSGYEVKDFIKIGGETKWDYLIVDNATNNLFVSHGTTVAVIDIVYKKVVAEISGLMGVHGIAPVNEFGKAYISEGAANAVSVIDLKTFKEIKKIKGEGRKPDAIYYDGFSKYVFVANGGTDNLSVIDPKTDKEIATIKLDGGPESIVSNMNGKIYVNIEDKSEVQVIDSKSFKILNTWSLLPSATPTGIAMDIINRRLFVGCRSKHGVVLDAENGKIVAQLPIGAGVDACGFDPESKLIFFSCKDGTISVVKENSDHEFISYGNITTEQGAKTMALDVKTHKIYASAVREINNAKIFGVLVLEKK